MNTFTLILLIHIYNSLIKTAKVLAIIFLRFTPYWKKWNIYERLNIPQTNNNLSINGNNVVLLHGASLGECKLLVKFLEILRKKNPSNKYVLTSVTSTGVEFLKSLKNSDIIAVGFFPFDTLSLMNSLIKKYSVNRVWIMETEIWPCFMFSCIKNNVLVGLVNARLEEKSLKYYLRFNFFFKHFFLWPDIILAQSNEYAERFKKLGIAQNKIKVCGNLKSFIKFKNVSQEEKNKLRGLLNIEINSICIAFGCIHLEEAKAIKEAIILFKSFNIPAKFILVPRYLKDAKPLADSFDNNALILTELYTTQKWDICIIQRMGILENTYMLSDCAVICGTFDNTGGHNMWDAVQFGIPVFFGPNYETQKQSAQILIDAKIGFCAQSGKELANMIYKTLIENKKEIEQSYSSFKLKLNNNINVFESMLP
jgi:3-deoxy-D-manno-octulosonic-acid transferase